jgi:hypothetical protein
MIKNFEAGEIYEVTYSTLGKIWTAKEKWDLRAKRLELSMETIYISADPDYEAKVVAIDAEIERITEILEGGR